MRWVVLFSRSGSEIYEISKRLNRWPDLIVTNKNPTEFGTVNIDLLNEYKGNWKFLPKNPTFTNYAALDLKSSDLITLHGYLRIIPGDICSVHKMYNGHPGDIITYPFLKGKDPQAKAIEMKLTSSGSVIHEVTAGVDEGTVVMGNNISLIGLSSDEVFKALHTNSIELWVDFLHTKLK